MYKLHTDMSGKISTTSTQGASYYAVLVKYASGYKFACLLKHKSGFIKARNKIFTTVGRYPRVMCMDNAGEMTGSEALEFYTTNKIAVEKCSPHKHSQNPRAELASGTIGMHAHTLLAHANTPRLYWGHAVQYSCELENHFLPFMSGSYQTCWEAFHGAKPDNSFI